MAEGTGLEPYSPCQSLVRGQGGLEDVHACVDLSIHLPVAREAHELLAHPISAPGATRWAGLTRPRGIDFDDRHTRENGFVFNLAVNLAARPRGESTVHSPGPPAGTVERQVLQDDDGPRLGRESHDALGDPMEPLTDAMPFPSALALEKPSGDRPIERLLPGEPPSAARVHR